MADALTDFLVQDHHHATIAPETLELLGKQASLQLLEHGLSLNESIVKLASAHDDINPEQVKRICEFANNATYLALHDQDKTAGANSSYPQFELADPSRIIQDMSDGARPTIVTPTDMAYGQQPLKTKISHPDAESALEALFKPTVPDYTLSKESAADDILATKNQLRDLRSHLGHTHEALDMSLKEASAEFYDIVKRHILDDGSIQDVMVAAKSTGVEKEKISQVMTPVIKQLIKEKVSSVKALTVSMGSIEKIAHRVVNPNHPMVSSFLGIITSYNELEKTSAALMDVDNQLQKVNDFIAVNFWTERK